MRATVHVTVWVELREEGSSHVEQDTFGEDQQIEIHLLDRSPMEQLGDGIARTIRSVSGAVDKSWMTPRPDDVLANLRSVVERARMTAERERSPLRSTGSESSPGSGTPSEGVLDVQGAPRRSATPDPSDPDRTDYRTMCLDWLPNMDGDRGRCVKTGAACDRYQHGKSETSGCYRR